jgi:hypothetical protein
MGFLPPEKREEKKNFKLEVIGEMKHVSMQLRMNWQKRTGISLLYHSSNEFQLTRKLSFPTKKKLTKLN